jgi:hypothetical protein
MLNVICVKHGTKYSDLHVNRLFNMVKRHLTIPYHFVCFTEDTKNLHPDIKCKQLPSTMNIEGWWWKTYIFANHFNSADVNLYFDLDMVIVNNIDKLVTYQQGHFVGLEDVGRALGKPTKLGSAVMRWQGSMYKDIWEKFEHDFNISKKYPGGDQDWIWSLHKNKIKFFPKQWILSYKWEVRTINELVRKNNKLYFKNVRDVELDNDTSVLAFHGTPDMEDVEDKIIVENWQ